MFCRDQSILDQIASIPSGLAGTPIPHAPFLRWLMFRLRPTCTLELGVDHGYSFFTLASCGIGEVVGCDLFSSGDHGTRGEADYQRLCAAMAASKFTNQRLYRMDFDSLAESWTTPLDLLHIDGDHSYNRVVTDYANFSPHVTRRGVILMHDTVSCEGPRRLFAELPLPKLNLRNSNGLGVLTENTELLSEIEFIWRELL